MKLTKVFRPINDRSGQPVRVTTEIDVPLDLDGNAVDEYVLHVGCLFNADIIKKDIKDAMGEDSLSVRICSPFGLRPEQLNDPASVFDFMDSRLQTHPDLGGFHVADSNDFNIYGMLQKGDELARDEASTDVAAVVINPVTNKLEERTIKIKDFPGYVNYMSSNRVWQRVLSWLPFYEAQGGPRIIYGAGTLCAMVDPRFFVNPARGAHLDTSKLLRYFGLGRLYEASQPLGKIRQRRGLFATNCWFWTPEKVSVKELAAEPNGYFYALKDKYCKQLSRFPSRYAEMLSVYLVTQKFLSFVWLTWMSIVSTESAFAFDADRFFYDSPAAAKSFKEHYIRS